MNSRLSIISAILAAAAYLFPAYGQTEKEDTVKSRDLNEVVVEGKQVQLNAESMAYVPTSRQKRASQNAIDLLNRLSISTIQVDLFQNKVETHDRKPVAIFIDYVPASDSDLKAMRMADVKKVEYFDYPSDPRLQGNPHVVNFIMVKYEYGGYVKLSGDEGFVSNRGSLQANARLQYKKMTYDIMGFGSYSSNNHTGNQDLETFRLPQADGSLKVFDRYSEVAGSKNRTQQYMASFRAAYSSDKVYAASLFLAGLTPQPHLDQNGKVIYTPQDFPSSEYTLTNSNHSKFLRFNGNYYFYLPKGNQILFTPNYTYSHTSQNSVYTETGLSPIANGAYDNTNVVDASLKYSHNFENWGSFTAYVQENYTHSRTQYTGSAVSLERNMSSTFDAGVNYSLSKGKFYGQIGFGWSWSYLKMNGEKNHTNSPSAEISLSYSPTDKHRIRGSYSYSVWAPSPNFKSENVIIASPLMRYTGNPNLVPMRSNSLSASYSFVPSNRFFTTVYGSSWIVGHRYVYDYEADANGILRTIKQPMGHYAIANYGVSATWWIKKSALAVQGSVGQSLARNGKPYDMNRSFINYRISAFYYLKDFSFVASYSSPSAWSDGCMVGGWVNSKDNYYLIASWSNGNVNIRLSAQNFFRWNYRANKMTTRSRYYDYVRQYIDTYSHANFGLSVTYTFGYGKKVKQGDELRATDASSSGILK